MDKVTIKIPKSLYEKLKLITRDSGYSSVTEFIVHVLRDLVSADTMANRTEIDDVEQLTREEVEAIRRRLKNIGYLD